MAKTFPSIVTLGEVIKVEGSDSSFYDDEAGAGRIKVRLDSDGRDTPTDSLPDAFPLLPKTLQSVPKEGEGVFVLNATLGNSHVQRYYIGPIISQPQFHEYSEYDSGRCNAVSLLATGKPLKKSPLTSINRAKGLTKGSFPNVKDIALVGRGQEDIVLKYRNSSDGKPTESSEVDIRAGIRIRATGENVKYLKGNVVFNHNSPGYIQVKYRNGGISGLKEGVGDSDEGKYESKEVREANSVVNVVADKINLISHKDANQFNEKITDNEQLVLESEIDNIMSQLHRSVYGDELIRLLKLIVQALSTHTHSYHMKPPVTVGTDIEKLQSYNFESMLSPNVRIS